MQAVKNIIITGSNKGIGQGIVKNLARKSGWNIIMACRNLQLAQQSRLEILCKFPEASIHIQKLDISDSKSIDQFLNVVKQKYKIIHCLVNNAGVAANGDAFDAQVVRWTFQTNFYGTIELTEKILPLMTDYGKIVSIGANDGKIAYAKITNQELKVRWRKQGLNKDQLFKLINEFEEEVVKGNHAQSGWPKWPYGISKLGIIVYHHILGRNPEVLKRNIQVYVCCPGYVKTGLPTQKGALSVVEGVFTPVYLIELPFVPNKELQGQFFYLEKPINLFQ